MKESYTGHMERGGRRVNIHTLQPTWGDLWLAGIHCTWWLLVGQLILIQPILCRQLPRPLLLTIGSVGVDLGQRAGEARPVLAVGHCQLQHTHVLYNILYHHWCYCALENFSGITTLLQYLFWPMAISEGDVRNCLCQKGFILHLLYTVVTLLLHLLTYYTFYTVFTRINRVRYRYQINAFTTGPVYWSTKLCQEHQSLKEHRYKVMQCKSLSIIRTIGAL